MATLMTKIGYLTDIEELEEMTMEKLIKCLDDNERQCTEECFLITKEGCMLGAVLGMCKTMKMLFEIGAIKEYKDEE